MKTKLENQEVYLQQSKMPVAITTTQVLYVILLSYIPPSPESEQRECFSKTWSGEIKTLVQDVYQKGYKNLTEAQISMNLIY